MLFPLHQYLKSILPAIKGWFFKVLFSSKRLKVGANFRCDRWPEITVDQGATVEIGDNVLLRRNVEIRAHGNSKLILSGNNRIDRGVRLLSANDSVINMGKGTRVGLYSVFNGGDDIKIGEKVLISGFVYLQTSMHNHQKDASVQDQGYTHGPVMLEDDVWLGTHVVILPNCVLKQGCVVGSNAVVTKDVEPYSVVGGVPAKLIKGRS